MDGTIICNVVTSHRSSENCYFIEVILEVNEVGRQHGYWCLVLYTFVRYLQNSIEWKMVERSATSLAQLRGG